MRPEEMPPGWIELRDEKALGWLRGNRDAYGFIRMVMQVVEAWDDLIDRDNPVPDEQINEAFMLALYGLPTNGFFEANSKMLLPIVIMSINAWHDANVLAKHSNRRLRNIAFHLRNMGLELYMACALIVGGYSHLRQVSPEIREFFALESFEDWDHG